MANPPLTWRVLRTDPRRFTAGAVGVAAAMAVVLVVDGLRSGVDAMLPGGPRGRDGVDAGWAPATRWADTRWTR